MKTVVCLKHPRYFGETTPDLNCKVCCKKYIQCLKEKYKKND